MLRNRALFGSTRRLACNRVLTVSNRPVLPPEQNIRLLCVSSGGGHWQELMVLAPAWQGRNPVYACTIADAGFPYGIDDVHVIPDCNRNTVFKFLSSIPAYIRVFRAIRPNAVVSTGALPGLVFILLGKLTGARTVWIESIANCERLSMCGRIASHVAEAFFVQAAGLADGKRVLYTGSVM